MTDPHGMAKLGPKGTVSAIYAGDHKTLLYTKCINYGPHRKFFLKVFLSMRTVDHQGLGQFAPNGSTRRIRPCHILYGFRRFFVHNTCSYIDPRGVAIFDPRGLIGRIYVGDY